MPICTQYSGLKGSFGNKKLKFVTGINFSSDFRLLLYLRKYSIPTIISCKTFIPRQIQQKMWNHNQIFLDLEKFDCGWIQKNLSVAPHYLLPDIIYNGEYKNKIVQIHLLSGTAAILVKTYLSTSCASALLVNWLMILFMIILSSCVVPYLDIIISFPLLPFIPYKSFY